MSDDYVVAVLSGSWREVIGRAMSSSPRGSLVHVERRGSVARSLLVVWNRTDRYLNVALSAPGMNDSERLSHTVVLTAEGHENVSGAHESTFEVTSDDFLTPAGDCILGIEADLVPAEFGDEFVDACQREDATVTVTLEAGSHTDTVEASGHPELTFESDRSMVVRTSEYVDERTVAVDADKAAADIDRELVSALADGGPMTVTMSVETA